MSSDRADGVTAARFEAARRAIRGVASAFRTLRLYPLHHARTAEALEASRSALDAYASTHGSLAVTATTQGLVFDFHAQAYEDDVVGDLTRTLRARAVPTLRFLRGVSASELGALLSALHLPQAQIDRAGGLAALLGSRGVRNLVIESVSAPSRGTDLLEPLLEAVSAGAGDRIAAYLHQTGGDEATIRDLLRTFDRRIVTRPRAAQLGAWRAIGQSLAALRASWQASVCAMIVRSVDEPWAASIASQWPPVLAASLVAQAPGGSAQVQGRRVAEVLRTFHRTAPRTPLPEVETPEPAALRASAAAAAAWDDRRLRAQAVRRLGELLPAMEAGELAAALSQLEGAVVTMAQEGDLAGLLAATTALAGAAASISDGRGDAVKAMMQRVLQLGARDLFVRTLTLPAGPDHPFTQAMQISPAETARLLLELAGEDDRMQVRRRAVDLLTQLAAGQPGLVAPLVLDPRWHVARNAVTVMGRLGGTETLPVLRAAMSHADVHVRREAMQFVAQLGTADAMEVLAEALLGSDAETQAAAAHWLGVMARPEAAGVLIAVLEGGPPSQHVAVKREVIRALGRLRTPESVDALRRMASRTGGELRDEAAAALARGEESGA